MISYNEFMKVEMVVARIKEVKPLESSQKLYVLKVFDGKRDRTLLAGLRPYYKPEELLNRQVIIVANLQPKRMFGIESEGMLLAAYEKDKGIVSLLKPDQEVPEGTRIG